jgi:tetrahydromethanopterin S-methyltransferase subunit B
MAMMLASLTRRTLFIWLLVGALLACKLPRSGSSADVEVEGTDHHSRMRIPSSWSTQSDLNAEADLQVGNRLGQEFMIVLTEAKEDFASMDVARLLETHVSRLETALSSPKRAPQSTTQLGAYPARQTELSGVLKNLNLVYLVTVVEGPKHFHGIIAWTAKSRWTEAKPKFDRALLTFQEI